MPWCHTPFIFITIVILCNCHYAFTESYTFDLEIKYYSNGELICDHNGLNITNRADVEGLTWIFPDSSLVTPDTNPNSRKYQFSELPDGKYKGYNLTVLEVDDDVFGYYTCVVVFSSGEIAAIRWGLNVDGADFSELLEEYKENAIVGGIAAGVTLVIIGICCFIWYQCFYEALPEDIEDNHTIQEESKKKSVEMHHNDAFKGDKLDTENETSFDNLNEPNSKL